jgi:pimeloyl-ACP methyl ester carboxylesterase
MRCRPGAEPQDARRGSGLGGWLIRVLGVLLLLGSLGLGLARAPERPVQSLVPRWAAPPSDFIDLDGQLVHFRDEGPPGDPAPIVLLHGTAASLHTWEGWVHELRGAHRVVTLDLPGFGLTGPSASGDYSDAAYVRFVLALLDKLKLQRVVLGGNSLGGEIAWQVAAAAPARVKALVLVDAGGDPSKVSDELVDRYFEMAVREGNREALARRFRQLEPGRDAALIARLQLPTLILWGGRDRLIPPVHARQFAKDIAGSRLTVFDELGHVPQEEDPARTVAALKGFLSGL